MTALTKTSRAAASKVSHNQLGQRLGRKGQATRERILDAMLRLLDEPDGSAVTLTGVAREAGIGLPNLYLYFPGISELLLAALQHVMENVRLEYVEVMRERWPDDQLEACCRAFVAAHLAFWKRHARLLHMRNAMADANDLQILEFRFASAKPMLDFLNAQMETPDGKRDPLAADMVVVLFTGLERMATVNTNRNHLLASGRLDNQDFEYRVQRQLDAEARLLALAIRDRREAAEQQNP